MGVEPVRVLGGQLDVFTLAPAEPLGDRLDVEPADGRGTFGPDGDRLGGFAGVVAARSAGRSSVKTASSSSSPGAIPYLSRRATSSGVRSVNRSALSSRDT